MIAAIDYTVGPNKDGRKAKRTNRANQKIASALGAIGDKQAVAPVTKLMKMTKEPNVRRSAIRALGKLRATDAVAELLKITEDETEIPVIRLNAVYALGEIRDPRAINSLVLSLYRKKAYFFSEAVVALVKIGEPAIDPLVKTMFGKNAEAKKLNEQNVDVLAGALEGNAALVLGHIRSAKAVEPLLKMVEKIDKWEDETNQMLVMTRLITALGTIGDKRGLDIARKYLGKEYWDVRRVCADALTYIGDRSVLEELFKFASSGEHPKTRVPLIEAIGNLGTDEALPKLEELQKAERDVDVTKALAFSVKRLKAYQQCKDAAQCWIGKLTNDKEWSVREKAAYELGRLKSAQALDPLLQKLDDPSELVRFAIIWALARLHASNAVEAIEELTEKEKGSARFKNANWNYRLLAAHLASTTPPAEAP
jgi:HEAT repeat protein